MENRVKREKEQNLFHVKDTLEDFEKQQANAATRQHSYLQSGKGLLLIVITYQLCINMFKLTSSINCILV